MTISMEIIMRRQQFFTVSSAILISLTNLLAVVSAQSIDCDFTNGNLCGWVVDSQDQLQLQIMQEQQPPPELKTSGAFDSDYVYVTMGQMATPNRGNAKMRIISPYFETTTLEENGQFLPLTRCFSFWYRTASWKRSIPASFTFGLQSGGDFFLQEVQSENPNVWRFKQIDVIFKRSTDQIRLAIDGGDTYFSYIAFDHFQLATKSCDDSQFVIDKYRNLGGNCPGEYLAQFGQPIGCYKCSLTECLATCEAFPFCRGVSWVERKALNDAFPGNSQCYLKAGSCWPDIVKFEGGYKFYERISGFSLSKANATGLGGLFGHGGSNNQFQVLPTISLPIPAPRPGASSGEMGKWLPRKAKEDSEFEQFARYEKSTTTRVTNPSSPTSQRFEKSPSTWLTTGETDWSSSPSETSIKIGTETQPTMTTGTTGGRTTTIYLTTHVQTEPPTNLPTIPRSETASSSSTQSSTMPTSRYSLVPSPFPNSKHVYGYVPLQPFGNCGGHFIIDENHQYLGCTRCSFAQCATLCSLSDQCRGFSFTESILVAKQCYLKTALTCEPQPSSTGFKYFIKIRKSGEELQVAEASNGRNGIGAFTIKPVMPRQTPNSEQESRETGYTVDAHLAASISTQAPWLQQPLPAMSAPTGADWASNTARYVGLNGNCAGAFLRDRSGEAVTCPRCSLAACQKLCDQDDECRGVSYSNDQTVAVQCFLKTVDTCSPLSESTGYYFHAKKD